MEANERYTHECIKTHERTLEDRHEVATGDSATDLSKIGGYGSAVSHLVFGAATAMHKHSWEQAKGNR